MGRPAARIGDLHTCPLSDGPKPHVGGPIITGFPTTIICGSPAARMGDTATCVGPPDSIAQGSPTVIIGGQLAARMGDMTTHGGVITTGCPTVIIGEMATVTPQATAFISKIESGTSNIRVQGTDEFKKDTYAALNRLAQTPTGLNLLKVLDSSSKTTTIKESTKGNTEIAANWEDGLYDRTKKKAGPGTNTSVKFNTKRDKLNGEDWQTRDPAIGLGHELIHAYHDTHGTTDGRKSVEYKDAKGKKRKAPGYELQAVGLGEYKDNDFTENKLRKEFNDMKLSKKVKESQRPRY